MIYLIIKPIIRATIWLFCKKLIVLNKAAFRQKGPLLIVANHPNSFLDAVLIGAFFNEDVHFLARGDAFKNKGHRFLLKLLHMIPIYRLREGKENLHLNEYAFYESKRILEKGGIVLIFIEGICLNTNEIQPFKKGAARIASRAKPPTPLKILPIGLAYNSFVNFGKTVIIHAADSIVVDELFPYEEEPRNYVYFNQVLKNILTKLVIEPTANQPFKNKLIAIIGNLGKLMHYPYYWIVKKYVRIKTNNTVFYDSVLFGVLMFTYPLYLLMLLMVLSCLHISVPIIVMVLFVHIISAKVAVLSSTGNN